MAGTSLHRLSGLAERLCLCDIKETLRLKKITNVRWLRTSQLGYTQVGSENTGNTGSSNPSSSKQSRLLASPVTSYFSSKSAHVPVGGGASSSDTNFLSGRTRWRHLSSTAKSLQAPVVHIPGNLQENTDPSKLTEADVSVLYNEIKRELWTHRIQLREIANYYFDGQGKAFRPMVTVLMSRALNNHYNNRRVSENQLKIAMIAEMIHTASLVHDDVVDTSDQRRGKPSCNVLWGQKKAILAGDFVLAQTSRLLAEIGNSDVTILIAQIFLDLVQGEFMQLVAKEDESERFAHYLQKTFKKTASLIAYCCKAVALLGEGSEEIQEAAFQYGRNLGIAFQLVDDLLDFIASSSELGKPAAADLKLGLATAPVLFACEKFPELNALIMRRFSEPGDVERAYDAVMESDGLDHTRMLAQKHCNEALRYIAPLRDSPEKQALIQLAEKVLIRNK